MGVFLVFEGCDRSGKSTLIKNLYQKIVTHHPQKKVVTLRNPTRFRDVISQTNPSNWVRLLFLFMKDREEQNTVLKKLLGEDYLILQDRYFYSSCVYQGILGNISTEDIFAGHQGFLTIPEKTFIIQPPLQIVKDRLEKNLTGEMTNLEGWDFQQKVIQRYKTLPSIFPECEMVEVGDDLRVNIEKVWDRVQAYL